jgi:hypothetical protein
MAAVAEQRTLRLSLLWRKGICFENEIAESAFHDLIACHRLYALELALPFAILQILIDPLQIVTVLSCIGVSHSIDFSKNLVLPRRSLR